MGSGVDSGCYDPRHSTYTDCAGWESDHWMDRGSGDSVHLIAAGVVPSQRGPDVAAQCDLHACRDRKTACLVPVTDPLVAGARWMSMMFDPKKVDELKK